MSEDLSRYYALLKDSNRRRIVELLGDYGKMGFKELKQNLGLGVGTVYYHLDMLSDFVAQDKEKKYYLNDNGRLLFQLLKSGSLSPTIEVKGAFTPKIGKWLFLSPVFSKTVRPLRILPFSIFILFLGAYGCALMYLDPMLFFYFPFSVYEFSTIMTLFIFNWFALFLVSDFLIFLFYRRLGNDLQLFVCVCIASFPMGLFPYIYMFFPYEVVRYVLFLLQLWSVLLLTSAFCFGKGLRLDKAFVISLFILYLNFVALMILGRFP
jgi:hypothetical protein